MKFPRMVAIPGDSMRSVQALGEQVGKVLSGGVSFGSAPIAVGSLGSNQDQSNNMDCWKVAFITPGAINTEFALAHNLQRVPVGYIIVQRSDAAHLYTSTGGTPWTKSTPAAMGLIYLKSDVAGVTFTVIII